MEALRACVADFRIEARVRSFAMGGMGRCEGSEVHQPGALRCGVVVGTYQAGGACARCLQGPMGRCRGVTSCGDQAATCIEMPHDSRRCTCTPFRDSLVTPSPTEILTGSNYHPVSENKQIQGSKRDILPRLRLWKARHGKGPRSRE